MNSITCYLEFLSIAYILRFTKYGPESKSNFWLGAKAEPDLQGWVTTQLLRGVVRFAWIVPSTTNSTLSDDMSGDTR